MSRFYASPENIDVRKKMILIDKGEAHHIIDVMRMKEAEKVLVFDGTGNEYSGFIEKIDHRAKTVTVEIVKTERPAPGRSPEIHLAQAVPARGRMDYVVEKATELGVSRIIPLITDRTVNRPDSAASEKKVLRWTKIATQAAKQCGRASLPAISAITGYENMLDTFDQYDIALLACVSEEAGSIKRSLQGFRTGKILVLIGPEGDFTPWEIDMARRDNCRFVSLGKRVLRSDTAGLFVLSVLEYISQDAST